jgi:hypothetical protein
MEVIFKLLLRAPPRHRLEPRRALGSNATPRRKVSRSRTCSRNRPRFNRRLPPNPQPSTATPAERLPQNCLRSPQSGLRQRARSLGAGSLLLVGNKSASFSLSPISRIPHAQLNMRSRFRERRVSLIAVDSSQFTWNGAQLRHSTEIKPPWKERT